MSALGRTLRRPWIVPLYFATLVFLAARLPAYVGFDPSLSTAPTRPEIPYYYPLLVAHILFGSIAFVTAAIQVWPWLRAKSTKLHRISGRVYVIGGVLPAGVAILAITPLLVHGPGQQSGNALLGILWLATTIVGFVRARQGRFVEHREWMLRSFALCFSILASRIWLGPITLWLNPQFFVDGLDAPPAIGDMISALASWIPWVVNLLIAEWFIHRPRYRQLGQQARKRKAAAAMRAAAGPSADDADPRETEVSPLPPSRAATAPGPIP